MRYRSAIMIALAGAIIVSGARAETALPVNTHLASLRNLHAEQYRLGIAADALWWPERWRRTGIRYAYGSSTSKELFEQFEIALNAPLADGLNFSFQHERLKDIGTTRERTSWGLIWDVYGGLALHGFGNPVHEKTDIEIGGGAVWHSADWRNWVRAAVAADDFNYNDKVRDGSEYTTRPLRYLLEFSLETGSLWLAGQADLERRAVLERPDAAVQEAQWEERRQRQTWVLLRYGDERRNAGYRVRWHERVENLRFALPQGHAGEEDRVQQHEVFGAWQWTASLVQRVQAIYKRERQSGRYGDFPGFDLKRDEWMGLLWLDWLAADTWGLTLGYLGSYYDAQRRDTDRPSPEQPSWDAAEAQYGDKAVLGWRYRFGEDRMNFVELLLSQELTQGSFGGGAGKVLIRF